jgi:hypothetical protein
MSSDIRDSDVSGHGGNGGTKRRRIMGLLSGAMPSAAATRSSTPPAPPSPFVGSPSGSPLDAGPAASSSTDTDLLNSDPFDDDLGKELRTRAPRASLSRTTMALAGSVLIVAGFIGGVIVQKNWGVNTSARGNGGANALANAAANGGFSGFGNRGNGGGGNGGTNAGTTGVTGTSAGAGAVTTGTVKLVDGTTIYLTTANGDVITVKTTGTTAVKLEQSGALKDIPVGATVSVQGTADTDGIVTATQVTSSK